MGRGNRLRLNVKKTQMLLLPKRGRRPVDPKTKLYDAFVLPHLDYCFALWHECSKELQCRVDRIQNYGMRLIFSKPPRTPSERLRQKLKWPHLGKQRDMFRLVSQVN